MKKKLVLLLIPLLFIGGISISLTSCSDDDEYVCADETILGETFSACCTEDDCYYEYNGKRYNCDGTDCTAAAEQLAADIIGNAKSTAINKETVILQILELRDNAMNCPCHKK